MVPGSGLPKLIAWRHEPAVTHGTALAARICGSMRPEQRDLANVFGRRRDPGVRIHCRRGRSSAGQLNSR